MTSYLENKNNNTGVIRPPIDLDEDDIFGSLSEVDLLRLLEIVEEHEKMYNEHRDVNNMFVNLSFSSKSDIGDDITIMHNPSLNTYNVEERCNSLPDTANIPIFMLDEDIYKEEKEEEKEEEEEEEEEEEYIKIQEEISMKRYDKSSFINITSNQTRTIVNSF